MEDLDQKILEKVQKENIRPIPKWYFVTRRVLIWLSFGASVVLGGLASGILVYQMDHVDWGLFAFQTQSPLKILFSVIPYLWLFFVIFFIVMALFYFRRTPKGYRQRLFVILLFSVLLSISGGALGYIFGLSSYLDERLGNYIPAYQQWESRRIMVWMNPDAGLLAGEISGVQGTDRVSLIDMNGKGWRVDVRGALWRGRMSPEKGIKIKLIGKKTADDQFQATEIRPWQGRGQYYQKGPCPRGKGGGPPPRVGRGQGRGRSFL